MKRVLKTRLLIIGILGFVNLNVPAQEVLNLANCRKLAIERNNELKIAHFSRQEAIANQKAARTAYLPGVKATSSVMYRPGMDAIAMPGNFLPTAASAELAQQGEFTGVSDVWMPGINLDLGNLALITADINIEQAIYAGGKIKFMNKQADAGLEIFSQAYQLKYDEVIEKVDQAYWNVVSVSAHVDLAKKYIEMLTELEEQMTYMHELGLSMLSEKLKVSVQKSEAALNLIKIENGLHTAKMYLNHLTGQDLSKDYLIVNSFKDKPQTLINFSDGMSQALSSRGELKILNKQLNISRYDEKIAKADYLPQIGVSVGYSSFYINNISEKFSFNPSVAGQISIPVFSWGQGKHKQKAAKLKTKQAEIKLDNTKSLISLEIEQVKSQLEESFEMALISKKNLGEAKTSLEETQASFEVGLNTVTDVLNAQANWRNANARYISAQAQYESLQTSWLKVTGQIKHL